MPIFLIQSTQPRARPHHKQRRLEQQRGHEADGSEQCAARDAAARGSFSPIVSQRKECAHRHDHLKPKRQLQARRGEQGWSVVVVRVVVASVAVPPPHLPQHLGGLGRARVFQGGGVPLVLEHLLEALQARDQLGRARLGGWRGWEE